jgi:DNA-binding response OmpR family regulator
VARILVIDDDPLLCKAIARMLTRRGHQVAAAGDGNEGLRIFDQRGADIVITHLFMPEKEGLETIRDLKKRSPSIKIVAISAGLGHKVDFLDLAALLGAQLTVKKPFDGETFVRDVEALLAS